MPWTRFPVRALFGSKFRCGWWVERRGWRAEASSPTRPPPTTHYPPPSSHFGPGYKSLTPAAVCRPNWASESLNHLSAQKKPASALDCPFASELSRRTEALFVLAIGRKGERGLT